MKLKVRPNGHRSQKGPSAALQQQQICAQLAFSILLSSAAATVTCFGAQASNLATSNSTQTQVQTQAQNQLEVGNLRLESDFRAVRLLWSYKPAREELEAAAFDVRYCELTSWNIEIKCRHRELVVGPVETNNNNHHRWTVIEPNNNGVARRLDQTGYEAQIFDLRALTNYTFQVHVARLKHQPQVRLNQTAASRRQEGGRGLEISTPNRQARIETKAFAAEATKCLAESSEVVVQTGRHFGGRISVEDSTDPKCQLLGNRSSEQTSYLFRIDHQACQSRLVEGSRIETMVLVHENKDILTHNTARFLVLCNFHQRAFTLRASVSLPRVQGQLAALPSQRQTAPAVVTPLGTKPTSGEPTRPVMLGSMPGLYRSLSPPPQQVTSSPDDSIKREELETNIILGGDQRPSKEQQRLARQSKELTAFSGDKSQLETRSLALPSPSTPPSDPMPVAPRPVQVQSKVLYVERGADGALSARSGRQHHLHPKLLVASRRHSIVTTTSTAPPQKPSGSPIGANSTESRPSLSSIAVAAATDDPIIMTNNHRLGSSSGLVSTSQMQMLSDSMMGHSQAAGQQMAAGQLRARSARMRNMEAAVNRMGEVATPATTTADELSAAETSAEPRQLLVAAPVANLALESAQDGGPSLAQNLTSYLLKWSLKQLTSLARKSLESLAVANETTGELTKSRLEPQSGFRALTQAPWSPAPTTTSSASDTTSVRWPATAFDSTTTTTATTTTDMATTEAARTAKEDNDSADGFITSGSGGDKSADLWPPNTERRRETVKLGSGLGQQQHRSNESHQRGGSLLVGLLVACALVASLLLVACLALARSPGRSRLRDGQQAATTTASASYSSQQDSQEDVARAESYRKCGGELLYNKLGGCASPAASSTNRLLQLDDTRSASSLSHEADCKTNELLFTHHVLVQTGRAPGESYA